MRHSTPNVILGLVIMFAFTGVVVPSARSQTFQVIHNFTGGVDGGNPYAGVTVDETGNVFGTATVGGAAGGCPTLGGCGTVYKLNRHGSSWILRTLYSFRGGSDGAYPTARMIIGPHGDLYSTTYLGGNASAPSGNGVVFKLSPPAHVLGGWSETVLHQFGEPPDGANPVLGDLVFDEAGNLYGTTSSGGYQCPSMSYCGTVFELTPSGTGWTESVLYRFTGGSDGYAPYDGVILDHSGNLYGTTDAGGSPTCEFGFGCGTVFELLSGLGWAEHTIHQFSGSDGANPSGGLIFDQSGNLYGTTPEGGTSDIGTVYELTPAGPGWIENLLYSFSYGGQPHGSLVSDASGNLYGTTCCGGEFGRGSVFRLTPSASGWTETDLYSFTGGSDGQGPTGSITLDANGCLYGTTENGGAYQYGVVFEITP
jgi:uncharacterized repeat protein (TIGR03803 family)